MAENTAYDIPDDAELIADLGEAFFRGLGRDKDYARAFRYYRKAADMGHVHAMTRLGCCYAYGFGVEQNLEYAKVCFEHASENGDIEALWRLGDMYWTGIEGVVTRDESTAYSCYLKALNRVEHRQDYWNGADVYYRVGCCLMVGIDVEPDVRSAYDYFISAIEGYADRIDSGDLECEEYLDKAEQKAEECEKILHISVDNTSFYLPS